LAKLSSPIISNIGEDVERQDLSHIAGGSANWYNHFGKIGIF
jgi:hypothetical protein